MRPDPGAKDLLLLPPSQAGDRTPGRSLMSMSASHGPAHTNLGSYCLPLSESRQRCRDAGGREKVPCREGAAIAGSLTAGGQTPTPTASSPAAPPPLARELQPERHRPFSAPASAGAGKPGVTRRQRAATPRIPAPQGAPAPRGGGPVPGIPPTRPAQPPNGPMGPEAWTEGKPTGREMLPRVQQPRCTSRPLRKKDPSAPSSEVPFGIGVQHPTW